MLLLVTDTSGKDGFVGLVRSPQREDHEGIEVIDEVGLAGGTFSAQLVPEISGLLQKHGFNKAAVDALIVVSGPGSFTGLRVGLAAIKALAEILQKPIVPVSLLGVLASHSRMIVPPEDSPASAFHFAVALDAGRGEAFVGEYEAASGAGDSTKPQRECLLTVEKLCALLESGTVQWIATPDQALFNALSSRVAESRRRWIRRSPRRPRSAEVAMAGWLKLQAGETVSPERLEANYIRRSDAEIFSKPASSS